VPGGRASTAAVPGCARARMTASFFLSSLFSKNPSFFPGKREGRIRVTLCWGRTFVRLGKHACARLFLSDRGARAAKVFKKKWNTSFSITQKKSGPVLKPVPKCFCACSAEGIKARRRRPAGRRPRPRNRSHRRRSGPWRA